MNFDKFERKIDGYLLIKLLKNIDEIVEFKIEIDWIYFLKFENNLTMRITYMKRWDKIEYILNLDENKFNYALEYF